MKEPLQFCAECTSRVLCATVFGSCFRKLSADPTAPAPGPEALEEDLVDGDAALEECARLVARLEADGADWAAQVEAEALVASAPSLTRLLTLADGTAIVPVVGCWSCDRWVRVLVGVEGGRVPLLHKGGCPHRDAYLHTHRAQIDPNSWGGLDGDGQRIMRIWK